MGTGHLQNLAGKLVIEIKMATMEMENEVSELAVLLEKLISKRQESSFGELKMASETILVNIKNKYSLNFFRIGDDVAFIQGLDDIVGQLSSKQDHSVIILSRRVVRMENGLDETENENLYDVTDDSCEEGVTENLETFDFGSENGKKFGNEIEICTDEVIKVGPASSAVVQLLTGKFQLQFGGNTGVLETVNIDCLSPLPLKDSRHAVSIFVQAFLKMINNIDEKVLWQSNLPLILIKTACKPPQNVKWICCKLVSEIHNGERINLLTSYLIKEQTKVFDLQVPFAKYESIQSQKTESWSYFSRYDILGSKFKHEAQDDKDNALLLIEFAWKGKTAPNQPPPISADVLAKLRIRPSDPSSPLAPLYLELIHLENVVHNISSCIWPGTNETSKSKEDIDNILQNFVEDLKIKKDIEVAAPKEKKQEDDDNEDDLAASLLAHIHDSFKRKDLDFTDKLWDLIRNLTTFENVILALDHIFTLICTREVQPVFNSENTTELAVWIREFYKAKDSVKGSKELQEKFDTLLENKTKILEMVADIGLEKYRRSYVAFFIEDELALFGQLEPILKNAVSTEDKMAVIWKLHHSLELVSFGSAYLHLNIDYLRILLKASLDYHRSTELQATSPLFSLSIPGVSSNAASVIEKCRSMKPVLWKCVSNAENNGEMLSSIFIASKDNDLKPEVDDESLKDDGIYNHNVLTVFGSNVRV